jgi:hypothetical protein
LLNAGHVRTRQTALRTKLKNVTRKRFSNLW